MNHSRRAFSRVWLPVLAILSTTLAGALCMAALNAPLVEPFDNWQEMAVFALQTTPVWWIIFFVPTLVCFRLGCAPGFTPLFSSPRLNRVAVWLSLYVSAFAFSQLVIAGRDRADLLQGRPDWIFDPTFDLFGSPILLATILLLTAYRTRSSWLKPTEASEF